jgi:hypothetical protein
VEAGRLSSCFPVAATLVFTPIPKLMQTRKFFGFEFSKIAIAAITNIKTDIKYDGKLVQNWDVVVDFLYPDCEKASQSTYLIFVNDVLKYAGEYSGTFQERWLLRRSGLWYLWHSENDFRIQDILKSDNPPEISIWLCVDPILVTPDGEQWNMSIALERRIIMEHQPEWNKRGRIKPTTGLLPRKIIGSTGLS